MLPGTAATERRRPPGDCYFFEPHVLRAASDTSAPLSLNVISPAATKPSADFATHDTYAPWFFH